MWMAAPSMSDRLLARKANRYFERLGPRAQVALCQLPLTLVIAALVLAAPSFWPGLLNSSGFVAGLVLHGILFLSCFLVPWERLRPSACLVIPALDLLAIWLSRNGAGQILPGLALLAIFPVIWLSASGMAARTSLILSFFGPLLITVPTLLGKLPQAAASDITSAVLLPLVMLTVSLSIRFASVNVRLQQRRLEKKDAELRELLHESRDRERLLQTILDTTDVGIIAVDANGQHLLTNNRQTLFQQAAACGGPASESEEPQQLLFSQDRQTPLPLEKRPIHRAVEGESYGDYLVWFGEGAEQRAISTAARPMTDDTGTFRGAVIVYNDVTGLVEALSAREELVANVSHEFRTPLNSILGTLDLVLEESHGMPPLAAQRLGVVQRNAERLLHLVSDLLVSASAVLSVSPRQSDLAGLIENSVGSARAQADQANISLVAEVQAPLWAHADPLRIAQVLDNLVSNAIKYSPGGGVVTVSAHGADDWVFLRVEDTGMGMSDEDSRRIFSRFFRAGAARKAAIPGAGLGLSITKSIVERHGGAISCVSRPGSGSTFTVKLPAVPELASALS
jgi:signal transduction histidine kinase